VGENPAQLAPYVALGAFALAFVFGAVANKTEFCTMGAVSDWVNMGSTNRMRMWLLAIGVAILGSNALHLAGAIDLSKSIYPGPNFTWLSYIVGGFLFGVGMTLGSGCGSKTLVRIGGGNLKSVVVFIITGIVAYMTLRGIFGAFRVNVLEQASVTLHGGQDLPNLFSRLGGDKKAWMLALSALGGGGLIAWAYSSKDFRANFDYTLGGVVTGLVVVGGWYVSGHIGHVAEDPQTLQEAFVATNTGRMEAFSFVAPLAFALEYLDALDRQVEDHHLWHRIGRRRDSRVVRLRARVAQIPLGRLSRRRRHCEPPRRCGTDGVRRHHCARLHDRARHLRVLDARARLDRHVLCDRRRIGGDDEVAIRANDEGIGGFR
jgi:uncharacterized membrane protein YedE/YeeE